MEKQTLVTRFFTSLRTRGVLGFFKHTWIRFWMHFVGIGPTGRIAAWMVTWFAPPHYERWPLAYMNPKGFVAPSATLHGKDIHLGQNVFVDDRVLIYQSMDGGPINLGPGVAVSRNTVIQTEKGGSVTVGEKTRFQANCFLSAAQGSIRIGREVGIAPYCAFYPHNHGTSAGSSIRSQSLEVKGDIVVEDGAWLGHGVTVLSGVRIGKGAVIGAGSTVATDVPDGAIVWGVPARKIMNRKSAFPEAPTEEHSSDLSQIPEDVKSA
jgi:acetyltransferase-like isoleucine patch superfamily enzyme